jgi:glycosyltransferase involved in cell wall biosynthesis
LVAALQARGIDAILQWFDHWHEFVPQLLGKVRAPQGTDIVHANSWNGFVFARPGIPLVVTAFHCVYRCGYPAWKSASQAAYHDWLIGMYEQRSFSRADAVVAMTSSAAEDFVERFALPPLTIIPGWVDTQTFSPAEPPSRASGPARILIVGNNSKRKGMDLLPALVKQLGSDFTVTVVGGLRGERGERGAGVTYKSGLSECELVEEYRASDLVVSLSRHEGFGYSILEAMACGKPVVAFDVTGIRDVLEPGVSGVLVQKDDIAGLFRACQMLRCQPAVASSMGRNGRRRAMEVLSEKNAFDTYLGLYEGLCRS